MTTPTGKQSRQRRSDTARLKKRRCGMEDPCRCLLSFTITQMLAGMPNRQLTAIITPATMYQGLRLEVSGIPGVEQLLMEELQKREEEALELQSAVIMEEE